MFPAQAVTEVHELVGSGSYVFDNTTDVKYILGASMQQSVTSSNTDLWCGSTSILRNYAKDTAYQFYNYRCEGVLSVSKSGNDSSFITVTYIKQDLLAVDPVASQSGEIATVSAITTFSPELNQAVHNTLVIAIFIAVLLVFATFWNIAKGVYR